MLTCNMDEKAIGRLIYHSLADPEDCKIPPSKSRQKFMKYLGQQMRKIAALALPRDSESSSDQGTLSREGEISARGKGG